MTEHAIGPGPKNIRYVVNAFWACAWYRAHVPGTGLRRLGHQVVVDDRLTPRNIEESDVIVFQSGSAQLAEAVGQAKRLGKLVVFDLDDDLWSLTPDNGAYDTWNAPGALEALQRALAEADLVTTTTPALADQLRKFAERVRVLPNMLPEEGWDVERPAHPGRVVVGWAGSARRWRDLQPLVGVVQQVLDSYPNVEFHVSGTEHVTLFGPHDRIRLLQPVPIEDYPALIAPFDIGLAPLREDRFNAAKSDLKFLEYGMLGIPTVAQHFTPYQASIVQGENGFLAKNPKDWLKYLRRLIEDPELRVSLGARAKAVAGTRTIDRNIGLWEKAYGLR